MRKRWEIRVMNGCSRSGKVVTGGLEVLVSSRRGGTLLLAFPVGMDLCYSEHVNRKDRDDFQHTEDCRCASIRKKAVQGNDTEVWETGLHGERGGVDEA